jgi:hypothetical protein
VVLTVALVIGITGLVDLGYGRALLSFVEHVPGEDSTAHFVLAALVTWAVIVGLRGVEIAGLRPGIRSAVVLVLLFSAAEELSQSHFPHRTVSLGDLFSSWLGAVFAGAAMARLEQYRATFRQRGRSSDSAAR